MERTMMKSYKMLLCISIIVLSSISLHAEKYAGEIFRMGAGVDNFALGSTGITNINSPSASYWNAALLNYYQDNAFEVMHAEEFGGQIKYDTFSGVLGKSSHIGFVITRIGYGNIPLTKLENDSLPPSVDNQPVVYKTVTNSDYIAYFGIGRIYNEKISYGITPKIAYRTLAEHSGYGFGADLGGYYHMNDNTNVGVRVADFFTTQLFWQNGTHEIANPSLDLEINHGMKLTKAQIPVAGYLRAEIMAEGREEATMVSAGPMSLDLHGGIEVQPISSVKVMGGYDAGNITAGINITYWILSIHYAYKQLPKDDLESCQRISMGLRF